MSHMWNKSCSVAILSGPLWRFGWAQHNIIPHGSIFARLVYPKCIDTWCRSKSFGSLADTYTPNLTLHVCLVCLCLGDADQCGWPQWCSLCRTWHKGTFACMPSASHTRKCVSVCVFVGLGTFAQPTFHCIVYSEFTIIVTGFGMMLCLHLAPIRVPASSTGWFYKRIAHNARHPAAAAAAAFEYPSLLNNRMVFVCDKNNDISDSRIVLVLPGNYIHCRIPNLYVFIFICSAITTVDRIINVEKVFRYKYFIISRAHTGTSSPCARMKMFLNLKFME